MFNNLPSLGGSNLWSPAGGMGIGDLPKLPTGGAGSYLFGTGGGPTAGVGNSPLWGQSLIGDIGNLFGTKTGQGALGLGLQGYNIYQQGKFNRAAQDAMNRSLSMQEEAWEQNQQNMQDRQALNF